MSHKKQARILKILIDEGYYAIRILPDGRITGLYNFIFTIGLCYGLDETGYAGRYCFPKERSEEARAAALEWNGAGHPKGNWTAHK